MAMIQIEEDELKKMIESTVNKKIEAMTDAAVADKVQAEIIRRLNRIFGLKENEDYLHCDIIAQNVVRDILLEKIGDYFKEDNLKEIENNIAERIAWKLKNSIVDSIGYRLMPKEDEEEED